MPRVRVTHATTYRYAQPVRFTQHRLMLRPHDSHDLRLLDATIGIDPPATAIRWAHDVFANSVCYVEWNGFISDRLHIVSTLDCEHYPSGPALPRETLDPLAETYPFSYAADEIPDLGRLIERQYPDAERKLDTWARRFLRRGTPIRTLNLLAAITQAIHDDFTYEARAEEGTNPPLVTLEQGRGACRDFALLMMESVRALGFAARFVSGYLYDEALVDSAERVVGGGTTHAWCQVYLPGAGWVEFDPTNGLIAGRNLLRVCVARTAEQAVPVAGGYIGRRNDFLSMAVDVQVAVG
jgi:transglutaminase-like putative cysteine protease